MARIKIEDIPKQLTLTLEEMRKITGGTGFGSSNTFQGSDNITPGTRILSPFG